MDVHDTFKCLLPLKMLHTFFSIEPGKCEADETPSKYKGTYKWPLTDPTETAQVRCIKNENRNITRIWYVSVRFQMLVYMHQGLLLLGGVSMSFFLDPLLHSNCQSFLFLSPFRVKHAHMIQYKFQEDKRKNSPTTIPPQHSCYQVGMYLFCLPQASILPFSVCL